MAFSQSLVTLVYSLGDAQGYGEIGLRPKQVERVPQKRRKNVFSIAVRSLSLYCITGLIGVHSAPAATPVSFATDSPNHIGIAINGNPVAKFVSEDKHISRPYFCDVHTLDGHQVTRRHPPDPQLDVADHATFHPGIWLAFGDISGFDYWRLKAPVKCLADSVRIDSDNDSGTLQVSFDYFRDRTSNLKVCREQLRCEFVPDGQGYFILWDSQFSSDQPFWFGDQEEMGLGVRVATALRAESKARDNIPPGSGTILDAGGRKNGEEVWGTSSRWCDYSGLADGNRVGITLLCHPDNFRTSWFHARDYGLLVANPFGRAAFRKGEPSRVEVAPGEALQLRFGIFVHSRESTGKLNIDSVYQRYLALTGSDRE